MNNVNEKRKGDDQLTGAVASGFAADDETSPVRESDSIEAYGKKQQLYVNQMAINSDEESPMKRGMTDSEDEETLDAAMDLD